MSDNPEFELEVLAHLEKCADVVVSCMADFAHPSQPVDLVCGLFRSAEGVLKLLNQRAGGKWDLGKLRPKFEKLWWKELHALEDGCAKLGWKMPEEVLR